MSGDDDDRERRSWSEIDRLRDKPRSSEEPRPQGRAARARAESATKAYLKQVDGMFTRGAGDTGELASAIRDAQGETDRAKACRAYWDAQGLPDDPSLLAQFLDTGDRELVVVALEALLALREGGALEVTPGLRTQLRMLSEEPDDHVAGAAEDLLDAIS